MSKTILYVDDEPWFVEALIESLKDEGFIVEQALNGTEAIEILSRQSTLPDLVILDVIMPTGKKIKESEGGRRTGLKVHEIIRKELGLRIPIIFVTVVDDPVVERTVDVLERSMGVTNFAFLVKPVLPTELLEKVSTALKPQQEQNEKNT